MKCDELKNLMHTFLDGELDKGTESKVRKHIAACKSCQLQVRALESSWEMLDSWEDIEPEPGYIGRFWQRLSEDIPWYERLLLGFKAVFLNRQLIPVYVTACIVLMVGYLTLKTTVSVRNPDTIYANLSPEEIEMVENLELAENLDLIMNIDFYEDLELIENLDTFEV